MAHDANRLWLALACMSLAASSTVQENLQVSHEGACTEAEDSAEAHAIELSLLQTDVHVSKAMPTDVGKEMKAMTSRTWQPPPTVGSRAQAAGVKLNAEGDLKAFVTSVFTNIFMVCACATFFIFVRNWYPKTYYNNVKTNPAPLNAIPDGKFGWLKAAWAVDTSSVMASAGLDQAMLIEFSNLGMRLMAVIGVPMFFILGPVHALFGGHRAGQDHLSYFSFGNVVDGSPLYWLHALIVWGVVHVVISSVFHAQEHFLKYRFQWLRELPTIRAHTVMVEGIPENYQSDAKLKSFFEKMFGSGSIISSYLVKDVPALEAACAERDAKEHALAQVRFQFDKAEAQDKQQLRADVDKGEKEIATVRDTIKSLQGDVKEKSAQVGPDGFNTSTGFVRFAKKSDVAFALTVQYGEDYDEWNVSIPPEPSSILWRDLQQGSQKRIGFTVLGYGLTAGLYLLYMPLVIWITQIAEKIHMGPLQPMWQAFAPTLGLQAVVAFLPTILILIFRFCFTLKDDVWAQQILQNWYFVFNVVFVILITAIGSCVEEFMKTLVENPLDVFTLLGTTMPFATHFYMNYIVLQWTTHAMVLTRYIMLGKYLLFGKMFDDDTAFEMSEPEDQDYYGMGARSCRMTVNACIGIIFGTLCPPIYLLTFIEFLVCRSVYGYLLPFAETRKPDLGGAFWVQQLRHLLVGTVIYCMVMTGVLLGRASTNGPSFIAAPSLLYVFWAMKRFERAFLWETLPFKELMETADSSSKPKEDVGQYVQPMLLS